MKIQTVEYIGAKTPAALAENLTRFFQHIAKEYDATTPHIWIIDQMPDMIGAFVFFAKEQEK